MPEYPIDLSKSNPGPCCATSPQSDRPYYPTLHLEWDEKYDLPQDGAMTVKFHKRRETNTEGDEGTRQSVELEVVSIESVKADKDAPKKSARQEAEEALDSYAAEADEE